MEVHSALHRQLAGVAAFAKLDDDAREELVALPTAARNALYAMWQPTTAELLAVVGGNPVAQLEAAVHALRPDLVVVARFRELGCTVTVRRHDRATVTFDGFTREGLFAGPMTVTTRLDDDVAGELVEKPDVVELAELAANTLPAPAGATEEE